MSSTVSDSLLQELLDDLQRLSSESTAALNRSRTLVSGEAVTEIGLRVLAKTLDSYERTVVLRSTAK